MDVCRDIGKCTMRAMCNVSSSHEVTKSNSSQCPLVVAVVPGAVGLVPRELDRLADRQREQQRLVAVLVAVACRSRLLHLHQRPHLRLRQRMLVAKCSRQLVAAAVLQTVADDCPKPWFGPS